VGMFITLIIGAVIALLLCSSDKNVDSKKIENLEITLRNKNQEIEFLNKLIFQKEEIIKLQDDLILKFQSELKKIKEDIKK
jgi:uncharacterized coiled-coil protein SlyX